MRVDLEEGMVLEVRRKVHLDQPRARGLPVEVCCLNPPVPCDSGFSVNAWGVMI